jgi:hypothetical protein
MQPLTPRRLLLKLRKEGWMRHASRICEPGSTELVKFYDGAEEATRLQVAVAWIESKKSQGLTTASLWRPSSS